ncbi:MAG: type IX secretion system sortase PorU [Bacteroidales bacterium]|nr:type IX secretion system sortase PorU [Bacteroidales bacterium]MDD4528741.1 type IX secretion system sortase PorU [Bacteroidales bacterium]
MKEKNIFKLLILSLFISGNLFAQSINYPDSSVLAHGNWYKFSIASSGLYKLTYNDFINLGVPEEKIVSANLSIYGNGGKQISSNNSQISFSDLKENSIYVYDPNNNFAQGGYVIFYGEGGTQWDYNRINNKWSFNLHPYSDQFYYFVTFSDSIGEKKRINSVSNQSLITDTSTNSTRDYFLSKQELVNVENSGRLWVGKQFISNKTEEYPLDLRNALVDQDNNFIKSALLEYKLVAQSSTNTSFLLNYNNTDRDSLVFQGWTSDAGDEVNDKILSRNITSVKPSNKVSITFNGGSLSKGWLDYILVNYDKKLQYNYPAVLRYSTTEFLGLNLIVENIITNVTNDNVIVWDVTNCTNPLQIIGDYNSTGKTYSIKLNSDSIKNIVVFHNNSNFNTIKPIGKIENQNLHADQAVDYVIITHPLFIEQANRLAKLHQEHNNTSTRVVTTEQIYNEFSSGTPDFLAYKEYLRMLYNKYLPQGKNPKNVLLFGDGTFDNKNILKYNNNFVLTYQMDNKSIRDEDFPAEDFLGYLSPNAKGLLSMSLRDSLKIGIGRLPIATIEQAENLVNKSERYLLRKDILTKDKITDWRNYSVLTADDADPGDGYFIKDVEEIFKQTKLQQPQINAVKIYSDAYKQYASSSGSTYPDASKAINQQMKKGCLIFNYVGHGSEDHLSSERLITITDIMGWKNYNSMPLMITSTCSFARFDMVDKPSAAEYSLHSKNGGMIALISASRPIRANDLMNRRFHQYILENQENNQTRTFGEAYSATKNDNANNSSDQRCVILLGDPALRISLPQYKVFTTSINGIDPEIENDTLRALSNVTISGKIMDADSNFMEDFNGEIQITLLDKSSTYYTLDNENNGSRLAFEQQKNILHKGKSKVENGLFTHSFTMPKDIAYNYGYGKLSYYAYSDSIDAGGYCNNFVVGGIDTSVVIEQTRPLVRVYIGDSNFHSGGITNENPELFAIISDNIAINTVGSGLGHDITATLDNAANVFILNDYFVQDDINPNKGYITFPFTQLNPGEHTLTIKAWNIFNFSSSETITFNVILKETETFANLKNYPNPFRNTTNFFLEHNQNEEIVSGEIHIFNTTGMRVKTIKVNNPSKGYTLGPIEWNGTTDGGQKLQSGIYIYRMLINKTNSKEYTNSQKLVIF